MNLRYVLAMGLLIFALPLNVQAKELTDSEKELIARVTYCEAGGESEDGQRLVIDTILNRMEHDNFPDTVKEVIYQSGQFACTGALYKHSVKEDILDLVDEELEEQYNDECTYFQRGGYTRYGDPLFKEGHHYFSKPKEA